MRRRHNPKSKRRHSKTAFQSVDQCPCGRIITLHDKKKQGYNNTLCSDCFRRKRKDGVTSSGQTGKVRTDYEIYMSSAAWFRTRKKKLQISGRWCNRCGSKDRLEVHHRNYKRLGAERMSDLEVLCRDCHDIEHGRVPLTKPNSPVESARLEISPVSQRKSVMTQKYLRVVQGDCWEQTKDQQPGMMVNQDGMSTWYSSEEFGRKFLAMGEGNDGSKITQQMVDDFVGKWQDHKLGEKTTVVQATLANGFEILDSSSCVDAKNYTHTIGVEVCMKRIKDKVWHLLGFLLQQARS